MIYSRRDPALSTPDRAQRTTVSTANITLPRLEALCDEAFRRAGLSAADAASGAEVLSTTDAWGVFTHGSKALRGYLRRLLAGGPRATGRPSVTAARPSFAPL